MTLKMVQYTSKYNKAKWINNNMRYVSCQLEKIQLFSFFIKPSNNSRKFCFLEGKINLWHKCILNHFNKILSTNCKGRWFFTIRTPKAFKNFFYCRSFLKTRFYVVENLDMELLNIFVLCFASFLSSSFKGLFTSSNFLK